LGTRECGRGGNRAGAEPEAYANEHTGFEEMTPSPLSVAIVVAENEQRNALHVLVDGTGVARTVHTCASFPLAAPDSVMRLVQAANPDVLLIDVPADNPAPAMRAIELLRQELPESAVFAIGSLNQPQVIVQAMRMGAREFIERPTTTTDLLEAFVRLITAQPRRAENQSPGDSLGSTDPDAPVCAPLKPKPHLRSGGAMAVPEPDDTEQISSDNSFGRVFRLSVEDSSTPDLDATS
jgi:DNA-binding NarL/FixJ family response regulator